MQTDQIEETLKKYFKENEDNLIRVCEEQDLINSDDQYYEMYMLDEFYQDTKPLELLQRTFYGYDADTSNIDEGKYSEFNPNRDYFKYNGYGNLVSTDFKDYSDYIQEAVDFVINNPSEYEGEFDEEFNNIIKPLIEEQDEVLNDWI